MKKIKYVLAPIIIVTLEVSIYHFYDDVWINLINSMVITGILILVFFAFLVKLILIKSRGNHDFIIILCLFTAIFCTPLNMKIETSREHKTRIFVESLIESLEGHKRINGKYPEDISSFQKIKEKYSFLFFPTYEVHYYKDKENEEYKMFYSLRPLGPFEGYSSKDKSWYNEE